MVEIKSLRELADQILTYIESQTNQDTPPIDVAYNRLISNGVAGLSLLNQMHNIDQRKECFPQTASENVGLKLWAELVGRPRGLGTRANLQATATGTTGETIGSGSTGPRWKSASGLIYTTETGGEIVDGEVSISILCNEFGTEGTLQVGDELTLTTTIPGIDNKIIVTAINVVGAEPETLESWRTAIIQLAAFPPNIGTAAWFYNESIKIDGITRAYPYSDVNYPGRVIIYAVADDNVDGIPTSTQLDAIEAITSTADKNIMWAYEFLPDGEKRLEAFASPIDEYQVVITDGSPALSAGLKTKIEKAIEDYFESRNPYINGLSLENQGAVEEVAITVVAQNVVTSETLESGRFADIGLAKTGAPIQDIYILEPGTRAKVVISYT